MTKIYLIVSDPTKPHKVTTATVDLNNLPIGANNTIVEKWSEQGVEIAQWLQSDIVRARRIVDKIYLNNIDPESLALISHLASFWENMFPGAGEQAGVFGIFSDQAQFLRTSPEIAKEMYDGMRNGKRPAK